MKRRISQVVFAVVAIVAMAVIQMPTAQCAGLIADKNGVRLSCDVADSSVTTNIWGEWLSFKAGISAESGDSASWVCKRSGLSASYWCYPNAQVLNILSGPMVDKKALLMLVEVKIYPGDTCAGCTACRQLIENVAIK